MKTTKALVLSFVVMLLLHTGNAFATNAGNTYSLTLQNLVFLQSGAEIQFDIYLMNTTAGLPDNTFYYGSSTYYILMNKSAIPTSGIVTATIVPGSELTNSSQLPNAVVYSTLITQSGDATKNLIRIIGGSATGIDQTTASQISTTGNGTKICRISLVCKVSGTPTSFVSTAAGMVFKVPGLSGNTNTTNFSSIFSYLTAGSQAYSNMTFSGNGATAVSYTENLHMGIDGLLPVQIASFTANIEAKRDVKLSWTTATENNNAGFEIQKSVVINQQSGDWTKVGYVTGSGTRTTPTNYAFDDKKLNTGKYKYRLKQIDNNGNFEYHNLSAVIEIGVPTKYDISQNYPNPFNPTTKIDFDLPFDSKVSLKLYDMSGRELLTIVNEQKTAGYYTAQVNAGDLSSGSYFYRIIAEGSGQKYTMTKKAMLIK